MHDDLGDLMKSSDPARTPANAPLDGRALFDLGEILADRPARRLKHPSQRVRWFLIPAAALAVIALVFLQILPSNHRPGDSAMAATPPLLQPSTTHESFADAMDKAIAQLSDQPNPVLEPERHAKFEAWYLDTDFDKHEVPTSYVSPQEQTTIWNSDLSGSLTIRAGRSTHYSDDVPASTTPPAQGTVLQADVFEAGDMGISNPAVPPTTSVEMLSYLQAATGKGADATSSDLLDSVTSLLSEWTLPSRSESAVLEALKSFGELKLAGSVTDRLGRNGYAFSAVDSGQHFERLIVISTSTGRILSTEKIYIGGLKDLSIPSPSVVSYTAWK